VFPFWRAHALRSKSEEPFQKKKNPYPQARTEAMLFIAYLAASFGGEFEYKDRYACVICNDLLVFHQEDPSGDHCTRYGACHSLNKSSVENGCEAFCGPEKQFIGANTTVDLRVAKGFGTKSYPSLRVSVITQDNSKPTLNGQPFSYSEDFKYKWTQNQLHSSVVEVPAGHASVTIAGQRVDLRLPKQGAGVAGVLIADPCVKGSEVGCTFESKFQTTARLPKLLNAFVGGSNATDFWGIFGDNLYDRKGEVTKGVYDEIDLKTKSKIFLTVPGNHDYWVLGAPAVGAGADQYANGHMQWYAQDSKAATESSPFDFSVNPAKVIGSEKKKPTITNSFWYNQIGNVGIIGYSGAYHFDEAKPYFAEACQWLKGQQGMKLAMIVGHWDVDGLGCESDMAGPALYEQVAMMDGCDAFDQRGMLKFVMGHTHCNIPHPHGKVDTGFMVAGQGMEGCGNYGAVDCILHYVTGSEFFCRVLPLLLFRTGIPIIDTTEDRVRFWNFEVVSKKGVDTYDKVMACVLAKGWRGCTDLAESWLDQPLNSTGI
jgi:hypothetical protein